MKAKATAAKIQMTAWKAAALSRPARSNMPWKSSTWEPTMVPRAQVIDIMVDSCRRSSGEWPISERRAKKGVTYMVMNQ